MATSSSRPGEYPPDLQSSRDFAPSLFPVIIAAVTLCSISTTVFVFARLATKRLISTYGAEDCKY